MSCGRLENLKGWRAPRILECVSNPVVNRLLKKLERAQKKGGRLKCRIFPNRPCQLTLRWRVRDWMASRAGRVHRSPESIGRLIKRRTHKKQEGAIGLTGRLGPRSGSDAIETGARLKGRRVPEVQKGALPILSGEHLRDWMTPQNCQKVSDIGERFRV